MNKKTQLAARAILLAAVLVLWSDSPAAAGWLGFRNDLGYTISLAGVNANSTVRVLPGETAWEWVDAHASRSVRIANSRSPSTILARIEVTMPAKDNVLYIVRPQQGSRDAVEVVRGAALGPRPR